MILPKVYSKKISIIVPIYKVEQYLCQCIDSLINQTYENIEILLINDGSPDRCPEICDEYAAKDNRVRVIHKENGGSSEARNSGINSAFGDYIMFVDSDDWIDLNTCEELIKVMDKESADIVLASYVREYKRKAIPKHIFNENYKVFNKQETKYRLHRRMFGLVDKELARPETADSIVSAWMKLYKKTIIADARFIDTKKIGTFEDGMFNINVFINCTKTVYIDKCFYHHRKVNPTSLTSVHKNFLYDKWLTLFSIMEDFIKNNCPEHVYYEALNNRICMSIIGLGLNEVSARNKSFFAKAKRINTILNSEKYKQSFAKFKMKYLPFEWKVFFLLCKFKMSSFLVVMLIVMQKLKSNVK
ncbi:MAG: glycosyltransferase family 2 protein [Candidatus Brocadiaceae bacterium]|nr:glycosyltransferase family 2 protein [Candidatus Brocadiaceae bacterium]